MECPSLCVRKLTWRFPRNQFHHRRGPRRRGLKMEPQSSLYSTWRFTRVSPQGASVQCGAVGSWCSDTEHIFQHVPSRSSLRSPTRRLSSFQVKESGCSRVLLDERNASRVECVECSVSPRGWKKVGKLHHQQMRKAFRSSGNAFPQPIRHITLKGKHISLLKPASIQYFPISSENIVTDVGHTVLHPLEATYQW